MAQNGAVKHEIVCATGTSSLKKRRLAIVSVYLPPSLSKQQMDSTIETLISLVSNLLTKYQDPILFIGGDFNRKDMSAFLAAYPDLLPINAGPTRRGVSLDQVYTNMHQKISQKSIMKPLCKPNGVPSDHDIIAAACTLPRRRIAITKSFTFRPFSQEGLEKFKALTLQVDWEIIQKGNPTDSAEALDGLLQRLVEASFPTKTRRIRNTDAPWFNQECKMAVARKNRVYKAEGKSENYIQARKLSDQVILKAKKKFMARIIDTTAGKKNSPAFYRTVKAWSSKEAPNPWDVSNLYPGESDLVICERAAEYFNRISREYVPIPDPKRTDNVELVRHLEEYQVSAHLKTFRKPKSRVPGDIEPKLVTAMHNLLAIPLTAIYNQALSTLSWPQLWKDETVSIIPKNNSPADLSELRNLSCTFFTGYMGHYYGRFRGWKHSS